MNGVVNDGVLRVVRLELPPLHPDTGGNSNGGGLEAYRRSARHMYESECRIIAQAAIQEWRQAHEWQPWVPITAATLQIVLTFANWATAWDLDNAVAGFKGGLDGLVAARLLDDDGPRVVRRLDVSSQIDRRLGEGMRVTVVVVETEPPTESKGPRGGQKEIGRNGNTHRRGAGRR